jgi:cellulose synthase/poly-beta-1,6-N-acetylglucosamine synthase-like glycosyltransferase
MSWLVAIFWLSTACVIYAYIGYPLLIAVLAKVSPAETISERRTTELPVSVLVAAHNEESNVARRIREIARLVADRNAGGELIVVSDGSTDRTVARAKVAAAVCENSAGGRIAVRVITQETKLGKAMALNRACEESHHPILILADVRQCWAPDAIDRLVAAFSDDTVGAVSGNLVVESAPGVMAGVGLYWRFEKWLRSTESRFDSMVSVTGCIAACRRELFPALPADTILDDVYWPLVVAMSGHRVVYEERALAFDRLPEKAQDEFRRKVRTLAGNLQLLGRLPSSLLPWRNRLWWQFLSHRCFRLAVPWALLAAQFVAAMLPGTFYRMSFWSQVAFYAVGVAGCSQFIAKRSRVASGIASFVVLNAAAWIAFWVWVSGRASWSWGKITYATSPVPSRGHPALMVQHRAELSGGQLEP